MKKMSIAQRCAYKIVSELSGVLQDNGKYKWTDISHLADYERNHGKAWLYKYDLMEKNDARGRAQMMYRLKRSKDEIMSEYFKGMSSVTQSDFDNHPIKKMFDTSNPVSRNMHRPTLDLISQFVVFAQERSKEIAVDQKGKTDSYLDQLASDLLDARAENNRKETSRLIRELSAVEAQKTESANPTIQAIQEAAAKYPGYEWTSFVSTKPEDYEA